MDTLKVEVTAEQILVTQQIVIVFQTTQVCSFSSAWGDETRYPVSPGCMKLFTKAGRWGAPPSRIVWTPTRNKNNKTVTVVSLKDSKTFQMYLINHKPSVHGLEQNTVCSENIQPGSPCTEGHTVKRKPKTCKSPVSNTVNNCPKNKHNSSFVLAMLWSY